MRSFVRLLVLATVVLGALALAGPASPSHGAADNALNMSHLANSPKPGTTNSDLAFWGKLVFAGNYGGFRIIDASKPSRPRVLSDFACSGAQNDVSVWKNLLFLSVDTRQDREQCEGSRSGNVFEGIRIIDVANARAPRFLKAVHTDCGSHTHTLLPDLGNNRVLIYVSSYPLGPNDQCTAPHSKISVVEVPLDAPQNARVVAEPSVGPFTIGCHDIGVFAALRIAAAACITEGQLWDLSDPVNPQVVERIVNPAIEIWHSGAFTWDGKIAIFGDEEGGAAATHGCTPPGTPPGAMWFYDRTDPGTPIGFFALPRSQGAGTICTTHNYNVVPVRDRYLAVSAYYQGGTSLIDFTNPASAQEIAYFDAQGVDGNEDADTWSSYWYNGLLYANDINRGVDIFRLLGQPAQLTKSAAKFGHLNPQTQETLLRAD